MRAPSGSSSPTRSSAVSCPVATCDPSRASRTKLPEHATRLAGILTVYEKFNAAQITKETLQNGFKLATYYAQTAIRLHGAAQISADLLEAEGLLRWLKETWVPDKGDYVSLPDIVQLGPSSTREAPKARHLISILDRHRYLKRSKPREVARKMRREVWEIRK